jgi:hypothetical protein
MASALAVASALWLTVCPATARTAPAPGPAENIAWVWPGGDAPPAGFSQVAAVVETLVLQGRGVQRSPRARPLLLAPGTALIPVVHVQSRADTPDALAPAQQTAVVAAMLRHVGAASAGWVQLDFEAPERQRESYLALVRMLRAALPPGLRLSVTAQAGWCGRSPGAAEGWLARLPADEVVPMLYRLGPQAEAWRARWRELPAAGAVGSTAARLDPRCTEGALGFSMQEPPDPALRAQARRAYWFHERHWSRVASPAVLGLTR